MRDAATRLKRYMYEKGLSQTQLAKRAKVSQSTVWRALNGQSKRRGAARIKLFNYVGIDEWEDLPSASNNAPANIIEAFERIWDHTPEHAKAIAKVIDALAGLRPSFDGKRG